MKTEEIKKPEVKSEPKVSDKPIYAVMTAGLTGKSTVK